jgi:hypothetical protein
LKKKQRNALQNNMKKNRDLLEQLDEKGKDSIRTRAIEQKRTTFARIED